LRLAVVTPDNNSPQQHARRWQAARFGTPQPADLFAPTSLLKH
jgi:hypothetical protein